MSDFPLITVSIPVYNSAKYLERCLHSVFKQTYPNIEILLVNDHGKDNSLDIINEIFEKYPQKNIRIIHNVENSGLSVVRNAGIDEAKGEFLLFLDSDDELTQDCVDILYQKQKETNATMVVGENFWIDTFDNTTKENGFPIDKNIDFLQGNDAVFNAFFQHKYPVSAWNKLFKVDFFKKNKIYFIKGLFSQDELWSFHTALKLDSIAFVHKTTYLYYLHGESVIFNKKKINFENHQTIVEYFTKSYKEETNRKRKTSIKKHIINFKNLTMMMQWKSMKNDEDYWKQNYSRLKNAPKLSLIDYLSSDFSLIEKKQNFLQNLPTVIGLIIFKKRYEV